VDDSGDRSSNWGSASAALAIRIRTLDGSQRQGDNLWSDSIVALDAHSDQLKWYYQEVKHDVWDYDAVSPVVLFDVHQNVMMLKNMFTTRPGEITGCCMS
jgi:glucose dehydrogenase